MTPRVRGFWIGALVAVITVVEWEIAGETDDYTPTLNRPCG
jgi:hypothetical protein